MKPTFFASCPKHLDQFLAKELESFQLEISLQSDGGIEFQGEINEALRFGLRTRFASKVYMRIGKGRVTNERQLSSELNKIPWDKYMDYRDTLKTSANFSNVNQIRDIFPRNFKSTQYMGLLVKDAICDFFIEQVRTRPFVDLDNPTQQFYIFFEPDRDKLRYSLYIDLFGTLSNRGYRTERFPAPLRENLAAAIVESTNWDHKKESFGDLMCGSGTLLTEAIIKALKLPGTFLKVRSNHTFPFELVPSLNHLDFASLKLEVKDDIEKANEYLKENPLDLWANDMNTKALTVTRQHIHNLKLPIQIKTKNQDALEFQGSDETPGVIVLNPPYGKRLEMDKEDEAFYFDLGEHWKKTFTDSRVYLFTGQTSARKFIRLKTTKRVTLYNGDIECRLFEYVMS